MESVKDVMNPLAFDNDIARQASCHLNPIREGGGLFFRLAKKYFIDNLGGKDVGTLHRLERRNLQKNEIQKYNMPKTQYG